MLSLPHGVGAMKPQSRRKFIGSGLLGILVGAKASRAGAQYLPELSPTPSEIKGPFYPVTPQKDKDFDLTQFEQRKERAKGVVVVIEGQVLDTAAQPLEDATVDIWQANAAGRYRHPHDSNPAPLDDNFQG